MDDIEILMEPALRGEWAIFNPPSHPKLAYDFLAVNDNKSPYSTGSFIKHLFSSISVEDTYAWTKEILSPVEGEVVRIHDGEADRKKISFIYDLLRLLINKPKVEDGFGAFGGNHILIKFDDYYLLLCHLRMNSITVNNGDKIVIGQKLGEVGNSGSSIQPHLHIQVMNNAHIFPLFKNLLPFKITTGKVKKNNSWKIERNITLNNHGHYLFDI